VGGGFDTYKKSKRNSCVLSTKGEKSEVRRAKAGGGANVRKGRRARSGHNLSAIHSLFEGAPAESDVSTRRDLIL